MNIIIFINRLRYLYYTIAMIAKWPKKLMVMKVTVCLAIFLIVPVTQKGFLTFCTGKVLYMPIFSHGSDNSLFNWSPAITRTISAFALKALEHNGDRRTHTQQLHFLVLGSFWSQKLLSTSLLINWITIPTSSTNWNVHFVMASQTIKLI